MNPMEQLRNKAARLRALASLDASHDELREAARHGELIARQQLKLHTPEGPVWYEAGDYVPLEDVQHSVLEPERRLVTTKDRWLAKQAFLEARKALQAAQGSDKRYQVAQDNLMSVELRIASLEAELANARDKLKAAQDELKAAEKELRTFVDATPVPA